MDDGHRSQGDDVYQFTVDAARQLRCSRRDVAQFIDLALGDDTVTDDVFGVRSVGERQWLEIDHAKDVLGYEPLDDADMEEPPL